MRWRFQNLRSFSEQKRVTSKNPSIPYDQYSRRARGKVMEELGPRKAELIDMQTEGRSQGQAEFPGSYKRALRVKACIACHHKGTGIMHHVFDSYGDHAGAIVTRRTGALISWETGTVTAYALRNAEQRGELFVSPGEKVYAAKS